MKLNYDIKLIEQMTGFDKDKIYLLTEYFSTLPLFGKIEVFCKMKEIEEENEGGFFLQHYNIKIVGEYRYSLFILALDNLYQFERNRYSKKTVSSYSRRKLEKLRRLREIEKSESS